VQGNGAEDEDGEWHFVGGYGKQPLPHPAADLRPIGFKSKFWSLVDDDESEIASQSPSTLDLICQAAVHGFSKEQLSEAERALQDSSVRISGFIGQRSCDGEKHCEGMDRCSMTHNKDKTVDREAAATKGFTIAYPW
jgi:hypothetical protein